MSSFHWSLFVAIATVFPVQTGQVSAKKIICFQGEVHVLYMHYTMFMYSKSTCNPSANNCLFVFLHLFYLTRSYIVFINDFTVQLNIKAKFNDSLLNGTVSSFLVTVLGNPLNNAVGRGERGPYFDPCRKGTTVRTTSDNPGLVLSHNWQMWN